MTMYNLLKCCNSPHHILVIGQSKCLIFGKGKGKEDRRSGFMYNSNIDEGAIQCQCHHLTVARLMINYIQLQLQSNLLMEKDRKAETESESERRRTETN